MEIAHAKEILKSLADGRNLATGQPFPPGSPCQKADTVRTILRGADYIKTFYNRFRLQSARGCSPLDNKKRRNGRITHEIISLHVSEILGFDQGDKA